ncbi:hypothetical protein BY996DRAFT_6491709 [Phakopsora pachyrhizi]|uniref:Uncharacterized protein n=1 Tax=Phakopsora pachyrhizi TaxID=170000 RepID=A0AAV0B0B2_PHAPC|nr:hypothetical protein BY996DRAFT_6491709 [Phakopsora pachyrhizi]CAH7675494.1 hypothetical protein PPACK8108_LOCUS10513 [Phakopsora pachyrhizi]
MTSCGGRFGLRRSPKEGAEGAPRRLKWMAPLERGAKVKVIGAKLQELWRNGKGRQEKGGAERGFVGFFQDFEEEGVAGEENGWRHWKEEQKLGGGAHQGQSGWSETTGATDL